MVDHSDFLAALNELENLNVHRIRTTTDGITFIFAQPLDSNNPLEFDEDEPQIQGNVVLRHMLTVECAWRIEDDEHIIAAYTAANDVDGKMDFHLDEIKQAQAVENVVLDIPGMDIRIRFNNGIALHIFCNRTNNINWYFAKLFKASSIFYRIAARSELIYTGRVWGDVSQL